MPVNCILWPPFQRQEPRLRSEKTSSPLATDQGRFKLNSICFPHLYVCLNFPSLHQKASLFFFWFFSIAIWSVSFSLSACLNLPFCLCFQNFCFYSPFLIFFFFSFLTIYFSISLCLSVHFSLSLWLCFAPSLFLPFSSHCSFLTVYFSFFLSSQSLVFHLSFCVSNLFISLLVSLSVSLHVATSVSLFEHVSISVSTSLGHLQSLSTVSDLKVLKK